MNKFSARNKSLAKEMLKDIHECELCGSKRSLEVHHIIPLSASSGGLDLDVKENMLVVCCKCHALLTPRNLLIKLGINNKRNKLYDFYNILRKHENDIDVEGVLDVVDEVWG